MKDIIHNTTTTHFDIIDRFKILLFGTTITRIEIETKEVVNIINTTARTSVPYPGWYYKLKHRNLGGAELTVKKRSKVMTDNKQAEDILRDVLARNPYSSIKFPLYITAMEEYAALKCKEKDSEIANLKTVMICAAEEIQAHWQAHCDSEGYGPANLMHRLEKGIPAQYGYTAGEFARQDSRIKELEERVKEMEGRSSRRLHP